MALISNYADLKEQIASWINRKNLNASLDTFIQLAEQRIGNEVQIPDMLTRGSGTLTGGFFGFPDDEIMEIVFLKIGDNVLERIDSKRVQQYDLTGSSPRYYTQATTEDSRYGYEVFPAADGHTYTYEAYCKYPAMTNAGDTNWLLANHSMIYLSAALVVANLHIKNLEQTAIWEAEYMKKKRELKTLSDMSRYPGGSLEIVCS